MTVACGSFHACQIIYICMVAMYKLASKHNNIYIYICFLFAHMVPQDPHAWNWFRVPYAVAPASRNWPSSIFLQEMARCGRLSGQIR